ncbi:MAG: hypothetical protein POH28_07475 [Acidocella sp.]|nr:hypothetical protein [Acidocella sp.]
MSVRIRFSQLLDNIQLTDTQRAAGASCRESVIGCLNSAYYGTNSDNANSLSVGSWGKFTRIRPPRDVDVLFRLPVATYHRFQQRAGNKQSQILQEVKGHLQRTYTSTNIKGDGPIVLVPFSAFSVEVIPAFRLTDGRYYVCMTDNDGRYKTADYEAEIKQIADSEASTEKNTRALIRMMKCWQGYCSVDLKSFWIELTAVNFLKQWQHASKSMVYYDWMVRDYLDYLVQQKNTYVFAPGTYEAMNLGDKWESKANTALARARKACEYEGKEQPYNAGDEWQKIFGTDMPRVPNG